MDRRASSHTLGMLNDADGPNGKTSFSLAFKTKMVMPVELKVPSMQAQTLMSIPTLWHLANLDLVDEAREKAHVRMTAYRLKVAYYFNSKVQNKIFKIGDLVLRRVKISQPS